jgi:hypothetical protein
VQRSKPFLALRERQRFIGGEGCELTIEEGGYQSKEEKDGRRADHRHRENGGFDHRANGRRGVVIN